MAERKRGKTLSSMRFFFFSKRPKGGGRSEKPLRGEKFHLRDPPAPYDGRGMRKKRGESGGGGSPPSLRVSREARQIGGRKKKHGGGRLAGLCLPEQKRKNPSRQKVSALPSIKGKGNAQKNRG